MLKIKLPNGNEAVIEDADLDKFPGAEVLDDEDEEQVAQESDE